MSAHNVGREGRGCRFYCTLRAGGGGGGGVEESEIDVISSVGDRVSLSLPR